MSGRTQPARHATRARTPKRVVDKPRVERSAPRPPIEITLEIETPTFTTTTRSLDLNFKGLRMQVGEQLVPGEPINILVYTPRPQDLDLLRVQGQVVWCREDAGVYQVGAKFVRFAPGDERRLHAWLLNQTKTARN